MFIPGRAPPKKAGLGEPVGANTNPRPAALERTDDAFAAPGSRGACSVPPGGAGNAAPSSRDAVAKGAGTDAGFEAAIAERRARIEVLKSEGPRNLRAGNARRAVELCRTWTELDLANADAWRCLGRAQQALGLHQDALTSFRKAKQHDPLDRSLDAAIESAQRGIVADFQNRYRR